MSFTIKSPQTISEHQQYYDLRWRILRAPWQQSRGTERDEHEAGAIHVIAIQPDGNVIGVARLHQLNRITAQIRYMAVEDHLQKNGVGKALLHYLEEQAVVLGIKQINLDARENCVGFYLKQGYHITGSGHVLYGEIRHQKMQKQIG